MEKRGAVPPGGDGRLTAARQYGEGQTAEETAGPETRRGYSLPSKPDTAPMSDDASRLCPSDTEPLGVA